MATSDLPAREHWRPSQLSIILLGGRNSGKASLGNLILGKEEFLTRESTLCSRRVALVGRCFLTVVDTPGWWCDFSAKDTPDLVKREIITSVSLCSPGPHIFLIAVKSGSTFTEKRRRALEEHVALLGKDVWGHCMVVFTSQHKPPEHGGGADSKALCWLAERCGQRCHTVASGEGSPGSGEELLEKIQALVEGNGWGVFERDEEVLLEAMEERSLVEERAQQRLLRTRRHRAMLRGRLRPFTNIQVVLLGAKGCGKTSTMHTILCRGHSPSLQRTTCSQASSGLVFGRLLTVVDTPGWWTNFFREESCIFDRREMLLSLALCPPGPHVFLLLVRVDRAFTHTYLRAAQQHLHMFGANIWSRIIVVLTFGDWLGATGAERYIESEGEPLRQLVERCGNRYHVLNNWASGDGLQVRELIGRIEETLAAGGGHYVAERGVMEQMEKRRREEQERAKERRRRKEERRQRAKSQLEKLTPLPEIKIVLTSGRKTGKSSCGNTILGQEFFPTDTETTCCRQTQAVVGGKNVTVADTPGCFSVTPDLLPPLAALLLVVNVSASFTDAHWEALERQLEACSGAWSRTLVLFSHGDLLGDANVEQRIESEGEPLQRLLERCGNRYHILDNQRRSREEGGGAQVKELLELVEEMLVDERLEALQRGQPLSGGVSSAADQQVVRLREKNVRRLPSCRPQLAHDLSQPAAAATQPPLCSCHSGGQMVALPAGTGAGRQGLTIVGGDLSSLSSVLLGKQRLRWTLNLPVSWFSVDDLHLRLSGEAPTSWSSPRQPANRLALPQPAEGNVSVSTLLQPALRGQTLRRLSQSGGLQLLLDRWDGSSLQELEAFIDSYFDQVWEETMRSNLTAEDELDSWKPPGDPGEGEHKQEEQVLSSIDRKLSKLELLEEIREELAELKTNLEQSSGAIREQRDRMEKEEDNTQEH